MQMSIFERVIKQEVSCDALYKEKQALKPATIAVLF